MAQAGNRHRRRPFKTRICSAAALVIGGLIAAPQTSYAPPSGGGGTTYQSPPASADWPATNGWKIMYCGTAISNDGANDSTANSAKDIVGDSSNPGAYYATSENYLFVRMRLDANPVSSSQLDSSGSWAFAFDTNGDLTGYEWIWLVDGGNSPVLRLNRYGSSTATNTYSMSYSGDTWFRSSAAGSSINTTADYFLDIAIPVTDFASLTTGYASTNPQFSPGLLTMWAATSANANNLNKDIMCWDQTGTLNLATIAPQPIGVGGYASISSPAEGATVTSNTPTISGSSTASSTFTIGDGTSSDSVTSDAAGNWTYSVPAGWGWLYGTSKTVSVSKSGWTGDSNSFSIACASGYSVSGGGASCSDIDECSTVNPNGGCDTNATCTNTPGSRTCACNTGYTGTGTSCTSMASTTVSIGSPSTGATLNSVTPTISGTATAATSITLTQGSNSITFTSDGSGNWSYNIPSSWGLTFGSSSVTFTATVGSGNSSSITVSFQCGAGTAADSAATSCVDINECLTSNGGCDAHATCTNAATSNQPPTCTCNATYTGTGTTCNPTVAITSPTNASQIATLTPGISGTASPSTSVQLDLGANSDTVTSSAGGTWTFTIPAGWGLAFSNAYSIAASVSGGATSSITFTTICQTGYYYPGTGTTCVDIDECATSNGGCDANATCTNNATPGIAPSCACNAGYSGNGTTCTQNSAPPAPVITVTSPSAGGISYSTTPTVTGTGDPNTSFTLSDGQHSVTITTDPSGNWSYNVPASWNWRFGSSVTFSTSVTGGNTTQITQSLRCHTGYNPDAGGASCVDIDECAEATDGCAADTDCSNTDGSFVCLERATSTTTTVEVGPDTDSDGIPDAVDNCKYMRNPSQEESFVKGVGKVCDFGDNNATTDAESAGMKVAGGGCSMKVGGDNGLGAVMFGYLFTFVSRRSWRRWRRHK